MEGPERKNQEQKDLTEKSIFTVPLPISENNESCSIRIDNSTENKKKQILLQAFKFHEQGNISEAKKCYQYFIDKGYKDTRVFSNYGVILRNLGKLKEAEIFQRKAIKINPNFAEAYSNLGNILRVQGKLKEAQMSHIKAIKINPNLALAHSNLAKTLKDLGKLEEAQISHKKAIKIKPDFTESYSDLGKILYELGETKQSFNYFLKAIEINPRISSNYSSIARFLRDSDISKLDKSKVNNIVRLLLDRDDLNHNELFKAFNILYEKEITCLLDKLEMSDRIDNQLNSLISDKLVIKALKKITFRDTNWEKLLTMYREKLCIIANENRNISKEIQFEFIIALAEQCFLNEYIYSINEKENEYFKNLIARARNGYITETNIAILACYKPLYKLLSEIPSLTKLRSSNKVFNGLIKLQLLEPLKEIELSKEISSIGKIKDNISQKVKTFYEENPYPRWRYGNPSKDIKNSYIESINKEISPNLILFNSELNQPNVLIAGCGTGQQILHAQRYKNAKIKAIDLSTSSLSYAQRKINDLNINNVKIMQMDLLDVSLLKEKFDVIECSGVLVCINKPLEGLKALVEVLKHDGFLKLGLYSELARQDIVKAREYLELKNIKFNEKNMRNFRKEIFSGNLPDLISLTQFGDFYTTSMFRDLCFHIKENRFSIKDIELLLKINNLKFLGFLLPKEIKSLYQKHFPEDKTQTNLANWSKLEEENPKIFITMYQFWVSRNK